MDVTKTGNSPEDNLISPPICSLASHSLNLLSGLRVFIA